MQGHATLYAKRLIVLRDLIILRHIRIEIIFTVETGMSVHLAIQGQGSSHAHFYSAFVQNRQGTRKAEANRTSIRIGRIPKLRGTAAKNFRLGKQLSVNFQTDDLIRSGKLVADTRAALTLREASYPPVQYVPRTDVDMALLQRTDHSTYCPYKGDCAYFSIPIGGARATNAVWTYEGPFAAVADIKDHLAFYPDRVDSIAEQAPAHA